MDLQLRGPGNLLGTTQHGLPPFRIADLVRDAQIVITARDAAKQIIAADPELSSETWSGLHGQVFIRHGNMLDFGNVG
jgi:ATP-dependent DNA helicase RecG